GPQGAAAVYGPQKGASPADVAVLDQGLRRWAAVGTAAGGASRADEPGAGAAGGVGYAALAVLGATLRPGIELVLDLTGFAEEVADADLVIICEGWVDGQTLRGKAPAGVAAAARAHGKPVVAIAGRVTLPGGGLGGAGRARAHALRG